jgi:hypothetical protein
MSSKREYTFTVIPDKETEKFTVSNCSCEICKSMNNTQIEWDSFSPKTNLQKRMKKTIKVLEKKIVKKNSKKIKTKNL